jgi:hypothetical protein
VEDDTDDDDPTVLVEDPRRPKSREDRTRCMIGGPRKISGSFSPIRWGCCGGGGWFHLGRHNRVEVVVVPMNGTTGNRRVRFRSSAPTRREEIGAAASSAVVVAFLSLP